MFVIRGGGGGGACVSICLSVVDRRREWKRQSKTNVIKVTSNRSQRFRLRKLLAKPFFRILGNNDRGNDQSSSQNSRLNGLGGAQTASLHEWLNKISHDQYINPTGKQAVICWLLVKHIWQHGRTVRSASMQTLTQLHTRTPTHTQINRPSSCLWI